MIPNQRMIKIAWCVAMIFIIGALILPFFFRATSSPFHPLTDDDLEPYNIKPSQLVLNDDRPILYTASSFGGVRGEKDAFVLLQTLPHSTFLRSLIKEGDAKDAFNEMLGQRVIVIKGLQSSHITENNGWILNPFVEPMGEAVTSKELGLDTTLSYRFSADREGEYALYARLRHDDSRGTLFVRIDDGVWSSGYQPTREHDPDGDLIETVSLGTWRVSSGDHVVTFRNAEPISGKGYQSLYAFALVENVSQASSLGPTISYTSINRFRYEVKVESMDAPYVVGLDQPFDSSWRLIKDGQAREPEALVEGRGMAWRMEAGSNTAFTIAKRSVVPWWGGLALALVFYALARTVIYFLWEKE